MKKKTLLWVLLAIIVVVGGYFLWKGNSAKSETIKIGATFPLTGDVASYGIKAKNGIQLRVDEENDKGGINGKKIFIDFQDDKNSIKDAVNVFNTFVKINKYSIVFGSAGSSVSEALVPISLNEKIILMSPVSGAASLTSGKWKYFFRTIPSDNQQAEILADWVINDEIKNAAVVYTNNSWGKPLSETLIKLLKENEINITLEEGCPENTTDFKTIIHKLKQKEFDAIISPTYPKEGGLFVKQLKEAGIDTRLYGGDNWGAPEFLTIAGNAGNGVFFTYPADSKSELWDVFVENYKLKFGEEPDIIAAYAYDAATAIIEAIKEENSLNSDKIRDRLLQINFEGVTGNISFKENGDVTTQGYGKKKIENGKIITINN